MTAYLVPGTVRDALSHARTYRTAESACVQHTVPWVCLTQAHKRQNSAHLYMHPCHTLASVLFPMLQVAMLMSEHVAAVVFQQGYGPVSSLVKEYCVALIPAMWCLVRLTHAHAHTYTHAHTQCPHGIRPNV